ncbi:MAG: hypothetical protein OXU77_01990 [Gammaproteobacteria bacterium]|nr:hypothetical protein [Gammaproteobacteria bacterium]MDE0443179.1 hypothetical protein [Gammaproteobacteria bacterium]
MFGTEFTVLSTFAEAPEDMEVPDADRDKVMHVTPPIGSSVLKGSDKGGAPCRRTSSAGPTSRSGGGAWA